jgi:hypothetical protein
MYEISGWTTQETALDYFEWLAEHVIGTMALLWDLVAANRHEVVNERTGT